MAMRWSLLVFTITMLAGCEAVSEPPALPPAPRPALPPALPPAPRPALPEPIVVDLSNDCVIVYADADDETDADDAASQRAHVALDPTIPVIASPDLDRDSHDVVLDVQDRCPDTDDVVDGDGDLDGCPEPAP